MGREILYRNIALFCSLALLLNFVIFDQIKQFTSLSLFIELIILPTIMVFTAFWIRKRIVIVSIVFFLIGFTLELILKYSHYSNELDHVNANRTQTTFSIIGLVLMIFAVFSNSEKGWVLKKINKIEFYTMLTVVMVPSILLFLLLSLLEVYVNNTT